MSIDDACRAAYRGYHARPSGVLPYYLLGLATPAIAQTFWLVGLFGAYLVLSAQGTLEPILRELRAGGPYSLDDPTTTAAADPNEGLWTALEAALTTELIAVVGVTALLLVGTVIVLNAVVSAGQIHAVYAVLRDRDAVRAGVDGIARDYRTFVLLAVAEIGSILAITGVVAGLVVWTAQTASPAAAVLVSIVATLVWLPVVILIWLSFLFTPQAVVVGDVGVRAAIGRNLGFVRRNLFLTALYVVLLIAVGVLLAIVGGVLSYVGASTASSLVASLVAIPFLDFVKTWLFASGTTDRDLLATPPERSLSARFVAALRRGWGELVGFVRSSPLYLAISTLIFVASGYAGWLVALRADPYVQASIANRLVGWFPPTEAINLTANNWQVGVAQAYSGLAAGIPTVVTLFYNGFFLGALTRFEVDRAELIAFVLPHGIIEIPGLLIAGALGLSLGRSSIRLLTGARSREELAADIELAYYVVVGLLIVFALAGVIEAFVSPYYAGFFGI